MKKTLILLILLLSTLRLVRLDADPPATLDFSGGAFADEGPWLHNARNWLVHGQWRTDGWNPMLLSPLTHLFGLASMSALGVGLPEARVSASVVFLLCLVGILLWPGDRRGVGGLCVVLFGMSYMLGMFGRVVLVDNMLLALSLGAAASLCSGLRGGRASLVALAGALAAMAVITKVLVIFLAPAWLGAILAHPRRRAGNLAWFGAAGGAVYLAYLVFVRWPNAEDFSVYLGFYQTQQALSLKSVVKNIILQPFFAYFSWSPFFLLLFLWCFCGRAQDWLRERKLPPPEETLAALWLLGGLGLLSMLGYRPLRYYLILWPPMIYFVASALVRLVEGGALGQPRGIRVLLALPVATALALLGDGLFNEFRLSGVEGGMGLSLPRLALLAAAGGWAIARPGLFARLSGPLGATALLGAYLTLESYSTMAWILHPEYSIRDSSMDLARRLPPGSVVTGQFAIQLTFGAPQLRAVPVWGGYYNADRPFERYGITHLLLWAYNRRNEIHNFEEHFPEVMGKAKLLHSYSIKRSDVLLYEIGSKLDPR